ncbi:MAG: SAM-dependent methyltransferase [Lentimicrobiaceae bacterium]|nr:SAM-dependent methyltransferase [Lentimicrobiaceae bacterium]
MNYELTKDFINAHLNDDVNKLALSKFPDDIDKQFVIRQIQARQLLKKKLPSWSDNEDLLFPRRLSLEQCSSELTAKYKTFLSQQDNKTTRQQGRDASMFRAMEHIDTSLRKILIDLTGGMGVDTSFLSDNFDETIYIEAQEELCELARHNFKVLYKNIKVVNATAEDFLSQCDNVDCIYLDPARRDEYGRKMVSLHDCSPDVAELQDLIFEKSKTLMVKLSPMLDIDIIKKELKNIKEIHVVAVKNECKELLVLCQQTTDNGQQTSCNNQLSAVSHQLSAVDLRENWRFNFTEEEENEAVVSFADEIGKYLYEPGVACMKAAPFKLLSQRFNIKKLHRNSHLYTSDELVYDFPGRIFEVINVVNYDKKAKKMLSQQTTDNRQQTLSKVSIAVRNFPLSADELRKQLGFKDGDDFYVFGTTMKGEKKVLVLGVRNMQLTV